MLKAAVDVSRARPTRGHAPSKIEPTWVWGLPLAPLTMRQAIDEIERRVDSREISLILSANVNYAMISDRDPSLDAINRGASLIFGDGMPLVWASRRTARPLPERVAGSDLIFALAELSARRGFRVFLLGGAPGVAETAAKNLTERYPGFQLAGIEVPPFGPTTAEQDAALVARIRESRADILIMAASQPRGEKWLTERLDALEVPVCLQMGASIDFAAGRVCRSPRWLQRACLEWAFRLYLEPSRLGRRYVSNALFLLRAVTIGPRVDKGRSSS